MAYNLYAAGSRQGYTPQPGLPPHNHVPWAITRPSALTGYRSEPVYRLDRDFRTAIDPQHDRYLLPYNAQVSRERRRLCQSELGVAALGNPRWTDTAVNMVSYGILAYLQHIDQTAPNARATISRLIGRYFHTGDPVRGPGWGFGRISQHDHRAIGADAVWNSILRALRAGTLDQKMAIHDAVGRKLLGNPREPALTTGIYTAKAAQYQALGALVREPWFDNHLHRGRIQRRGGTAYNRTGGIAAVGAPVPQTYAARRRAMDHAAQDPNRARQVNADAYYDGVAFRNLLFAGGISGTTGTLLQSAMVFGNVHTGANSQEQLKQYTLAIISYLVGGGMHSYHESMVIARQAGVPYRAGAYEGSLPNSLRVSRWYHDWEERYYEIVVKGDRHMRYVRDFIPSYKNRALTHRDQDSRVDRRLGYLAMPPLPTKDYFD